MRLKLSFRYGLELPARIGLLAWIGGWLSILVCILYNGRFNVAGRGGETTIYRDEAPLWFWGTASFVIFLILLGLAFTFELSSNACADDSAEENR